MLLIIMVDLVFAGPVAKSVPLTFVSFINIQCLVISGLNVEVPYYFGEEKIN